MTSENPTALFEMEILPCGPESPSMLKLPHCDSTVTTSSDEENYFVHLSSDLDGWSPFMTGRNPKRVHTSALFYEMQTQVRAMIEAHHACDLHEREISRKIAEAYPLQDVPAQSQFLDSTHLPDSSHIHIHGPDGSCCSSVRGSPGDLLIDKDSNFQSRLRELPLPFTEVLLAEALAELPCGAAMVLDTCVRCWRCGRLAPGELAATARSFACSSPALGRALGAAAANFRVRAMEIESNKPDGEEATAEQMEELVRLARSKKRRVDTLTHMCDSTKQA